MSAITPGKSMEALRMIHDAMVEVRNLQAVDDGVPQSIVTDLERARVDLATYVCDEWDKSRTMENGAD